MLRFADAAETLAEVWFSGKEPHPLSEALQRYILGSGVFGTLSNHVSAARTRHGGKLRYLLKKVFPPFDALACQFPVLCKHPWLLPICTVCRWFRLLFTKDARRTIQIAKHNASISPKDVETVAGLMHQLEL